MTPVRRFAHGSRVPGWDEAVDLDKDPAEIPDPATTEVPEGLREEIEAHMANYPERRSAALPALAAAQRVHGWCSPEAIEQVACVMGVTPAYLASVASFYDMLETTPVGSHSVYVCTNISCSLRGADALYEAMRDAVDGTGSSPTTGSAPHGVGGDSINVRPFECLGACDIAPMASVDGVYVGPLSLADVPQLLDDLRAGRPVLPDKQLARRLVADPRANTREFPLHPAAHERGGE
jgi:NADH:ubiquinone oxidoreductase subunit E